jgi:2-succinyl-5-enolpyruvyl-6-hydroxy-3-cyclohexene-1-carboxylate synthase
VTGSEALARSVIAACLRRGVREFVACPGSRNSPLLLAALASGARVWPFVDERAAGFFALGRAVARDEPVAVLTTSGTAVAELLPAVVEALYQRVPLLCVTADRPARFRGSGAPQAIEQRGIFCLYAVASWEAAQGTGTVDLADWSGAGPAHLNVCLEEPLLGRPPETGALGPVEVAEREEDSAPGSMPFLMPRPDVILLGPLRDRDRDRVRSRVARWGVPVLAEAASGLRGDAALAAVELRGGERSLRGHPVRHVLRIGGVPSFRWWRDLEDRPEVTVWSVLCGGFRGLGRDCLVLPDFEGVRFQDGPEPAFPERDGFWAERLGQVLARFPLSEPALVRAVAEQVPPGSRVYLGNSLPIREWNLAAPCRDRGFRVWANRGANGIDGNLGSWLGWSADGDGESWALVGDLTAIYDANAPWILPHLPAATRRLVVVNNGGGRIFSRLPGFPDLAEPVKTFTESVHGFRFRAWAEGWGLGYREWRGGPFPAWPEEAGPATVLEVIPDPGQTEGFWKALEVP